MESKPTNAGKVNDIIGCSDECCVEEVGDMLKKLVRVFQLFERDQIKVHGVTTSQCYCLLEIFKAEKLTMNELSQRMKLDSSTLTRVVDNLVRDGLVARKRDDKDRRIVLLVLTSQGKEQARVLGHSIGAYYKKILEGIPEDQLASVFKSVGLLLSAFEAANPNCC